MFFEDRAARLMWNKMRLPLLPEMIADNMWRAMGWTRDTRPHAVLRALQYAFAWKSTAPTTTRDGSTNGVGTLEDVSGTRVCQNERVTKNGATKEKSV